jgi:single-strand DNA-binding protein
MLNKIVLMGRLTTDPELKHTESGVAVTSFTLAVERPRAKEKTTDFINIVCWRRTAEFVFQRFSKGLLIAVDGHLQSRTFESKGTTKTVVEVYADNVFFTGDKND